MVFSNTKRFILPALISFMLLLACASQNAQRTEFKGAAAFENDDILAAIEKRHGIISAAVEKGRLDPLYAAKANRLRLALEQFIVRQNAEMKALFLERQYGETNQYDAVDEQLRQIFGRIAQKKIECLQQMQMLLTESSLLPVDRLEKAASEAVATSGQPPESGAKETRWQTRELDIEIEIAPEDITDGARE